MISVQPFRAQFLCGREWTDCIVLGVTGADYMMPQFVVMYEDDGVSTLLRVRDVKLVGPAPTLFA